MSDRTPLRHRVWLNLAQTLDSKIFLISKQNLGKSRQTFVVSASQFEYT